MTTKKKTKNHKEDYQKYKEYYKAHSREWAKNNPEKRKKTCKNWRQKIKAEVIEAYGGKCTCCGETTPEFLTIDHINNDGSAHRKATTGKNRGSEMAGGKMYKYLKELGFPKDNYQLLCMNCNFAKGLYKECPHKRDSKDTNNNPDVS